MIAPERSLHPFEQCDAKLKLIVIWFPAFRGASLVHFFLTEFLLASCHISLCFDWPFGFSTLNHLCHHFGPIFSCSTAATSLVWVRL